MSSMQMPPNGGSPAMEQVRSPVNPTDMAMAAKRGEVGDTFGQYMERQWGVKWDDPLQVAGQKMQQKIQLGNPVKKAQAVAQMGGQQDSGMPPSGGGQMGSGSAINDLMSKYGG